MTKGRVRALAFLWLALAAAGTLLALAARGAGPLLGDLALTRALQAAVPPDGAAGAVLARIGDAAWLLPAAAVLGACLRRRWSVALFVALACLGAVALADGVLAPLVARPRPAASLVRVSEQGRGYGFPSRTALMSLVLIGSVGYFLREGSRPGGGRGSGPTWRLALGVGGLLLALIGASRLWVGDHWATDIAGGWLLGAAWLLLLVAAWRRWACPRGGSPRAVAARGR